MKLIITEKPSVGKAIASALGIKPGADGIYTGNGWIVSWCVGHLVGMADAGKYDERYKRWRYEDLPILPEPFAYTLIPGKEAVYKNLAALMNRPDVEAVVNACDAGREGELIFRLVYDMAGCKKPILRLWISSMEDSAIREGFRDLRPGGEYDALYQSALCRQNADWLVGINATRLFSVLYHRTLNVGRVQTPTLALLTQRQGKIDLFQKEKYHHVYLQMDGADAVSERITDSASAEQVKDTCTGAVIRCTSVVREKKTERPPKLYDLTTLQREANRIFGYTAKETLDYAQSLYEKKLLTYPRTDSRHLTSDMAESAAAVCHLAARISPFNGCRDFFPEVSGLISDKDVSDHHAIIPTMEIEKAEVSALPVGERKIFLLVCCKLLCAVAEPYVYETVTATFDCAGHSFTAKGKCVLSEGWREIYRLFLASLKEKQEDAEDGILPEFTEGQTFLDAVAVVTEHFTTPPKPYTEDTLLSAMERAGAEETPDNNGVPAKSQDFVGEGGATERNGCSPSGGRSEAEFVTTQRKGLGTPATRASIIEKLVSAGFVERKGKSLIPTKEGVNLVTVLPEVLTSPMLTAQWEQQLTAIAGGTADPAVFLCGIENMVRELVQTYSFIEEGRQKLFAPEKESLGACPRCGKPVYEGKHNFACSDRACGFVLWKNDRFWVNRKKELTGKMVRDLLKKGHTNVKGLWSEKKGSTYDAAVVLDDTGGKYVNFKLDFAPKKNKVTHPER